MELRLPTEGELTDLARVARPGVHPPDEMPFLVPWTDDLHSDSFVESFVDYHVEGRAGWRPERWRLELGVWLNGSPIGVQAVGAESFARDRTVASGSWLAQRYQGKGYGTEMRAAILELAFQGLGAVAASSSALEGNVASARISEKLGYEGAGERWPLIRGRPVHERQFILRRERWEQLDRPPVEVAGLASSLPLFGVAEG